MAAIIAQGRPGATSGTCPVRLAFLRRTPGGTLSVPEHARTDQGHRTSMRRVPGVHVLSMEPRSLGVAGASFIPEGSFGRNGVGRGGRDGGLIQTASDR